MQTVKTGVIYNGVGINASFVSGGAFSLDGVHMTPWEMPCWQTLS
jgi:hypothetical protein